MPLLKLALICIGVMGLVTLVVYVIGIILANILLK